MVRLASLFDIRFNDAQSKTLTGVSVDMMVIVWANPGAREVRPLDSNVGNDAVESREAAEVKQGKPHDTRPHHGRGEEIIASEG